MVMSQALLIAVGVDWDRRRQILAVEMAIRESRNGIGRIEPFGVRSLEGPGGAKRTSC